MMYEATQSQAADPLLLAMATAQQQHRLFPTAVAPQTVIVGVSGGADSLCLLHALCQHASSWKLDLHVAHLDHALRADSSEDAAFVAQLAQQWHLPFHTIRLPARTLTDDAQAGPYGGVEAGARRARYEFLADVARQQTPLEQSPLIAVAHHADDQAETLLMRLITGSGLAGLAGMRPVSTLAPQYLRLPQKVQDRTILLVRPLLGVGRAEIEAYLVRQGLTWREDSTNRDTAFLRNRLRHEIMPRLTEINPRLSETIGQTAEILAAEAERSSQWDQETLCRLICETDSEAISPEKVPTRLLLDLPSLLALDKATQRSVLRLALAQLGGDLRESGFAAIERLRRRLATDVCAQGPHPLVGTLAWTIIRAQEPHPARLALHDASRLPLQLEHPFLDQAWRDRHTSQSIAPAGEVTLNNGWRLQSQTYPRAMLPGTWRAQNQPWQAFLDASQVGEPVLTTPRAGLRFAPLGMAGHHKTLGDYFTDRKVPVALRTGWPVIVDRVKSTVLWVCGLHIDHNARITPETRQVQELLWLPANKLP